MPDCVSRLLLIMAIRPAATDYRHDTISARQSFPQTQILFDVIASRVLVRDADLKWRSLRCFGERSPQVSLRRSRTKIYTRDSLEKKEEEKKRGYQKASIRRMR